MHGLKKIFFIPKQPYPLILLFHEHFEVPSTSQSSKDSVNFPLVRKGQGRTGLTFHTDVSMKVSLQ